MSAEIDVKALEAAEILAIPLDAPERIFPQDESRMKAIFRRLRSRWHQDHNAHPQANDVFNHLYELHEKALEKLRLGIWREHGVFTCTLANGKKFRVSSDAEREVDVGRIHISRTTATYVVEGSHSDLFANALAAFDLIRFDDAKLRETYSAHVPTTRNVYESQDSRRILTIRKSPEDILLRDLIGCIDEKDRARHVAWMVSRMLGLARLLNHFGLAHNAITLDNLFVSPEKHAISLFGGWWYAKPLGQPLEYVPPEAVEFLSKDKGKILASSRLDLEMVKAAGRELLGDRGGTSFLISKPAPDPMIEFLRQPAPDDPQKDLERWYGSVLPASFGPRKFIALPVTYADVYRPA